MAVQSFLVFHRLVLEVALHGLVTWCRTTFHTETHGAGIEQVHGHFRNSIMEFLHHLCTSNKHQEEKKMTTPALIQDGESLTGG